MQLLSKVHSVTFRLFVKLNKNKTILWGKKPNAEFFTQLRWQSYTCRGTSPITPLPTFLIRLVVAQIQHMGLLNLWQQQVVHTHRYFDPPVLPASVVYAGLNFNLLNKIQFTSMPVKFWKFQIHQKLYQFGLSEDGPSGTHLD